MKSSVFKQWHAISGLGGILMGHGIVMGTCVPRVSDAQMTTAALLFISGIATVLMSLAVRRWPAARITFWMGGLRLIGGLLCIVTHVASPVDYRHLLVTMMILIAVLEFLAAARLRQADIHSRPLQLSAVVGVFASAGLLHSYPTISDVMMSALLGLSMTMSGFAYLGLAFQNRRSQRAVHAAIRRLTHTATGNVEAA